MISLPLDELYLQWLYSQVAEVKYRTPSRTYWNLFRKLYKTQFVWWVPNDDNRVADGKDLRQEFLRDIRADVMDDSWMELNCSFLEMLIALSRRLCFEAEGTTPEWFWHLLHTLQLDKYTDNRRLPEDTVEDILNTVMWRTYRKDGRGGLFPLRHSREDQREVEIWYQLNAYLMENDA